jgi:hypothetical protein
MMPDEAREQIHLQLHAIDAKIASLTANVVEISAQRGTTLKAMTGMEHLLVIFEELRTGYLAALDAFDQDRPELAQKRLELLSALRARLAQWMR